MALRGFTVGTNGATLRDGVRFRNIGCNYRWGIARSYGQTNPTGFVATPAAERDAGLEYLASIGVKVVRVAAYPIYPNQWTAAVLNGKSWSTVTNADVDAYLSAYVDPFVAKCRSLGMTALLVAVPRLLTPSDLTGETGRALFTPGSNARGLVQRITERMVTRYLAEDAVGGYIGFNELNNYVNQTNMSWAAVNTAYGTQASYPTATTTYNQQEMRDMLTWWHGIVTAIDSQRITLTGHGTCRYAKPGGAGEIPFPLADYYRELVLDNPTSAAQIHWYGNVPYCSPNDRGLDSFLAGCRHWPAIYGKPFVLGEWGDQPVHIGSITAAGGVATFTVSGTDALCCEPGDQVQIIDAGDWNGIYTLATLSANRLTATAPISSAPGAPFSGTASALYQAEKFQRDLDAIIDSGVDISLLWNYDTDPAYPRGMSCDPYGPNAWQGPLIAAANARLAAMGY